MKKTAFLFFALMSFTTMLYAQSVSAGIRGGLSIPNLTSPNGNPVSEGYSSRLGGDAAVFVDIRFSELFSIQPMIEYSQQGGKRNGRQAFPVPPQYQNIPQLGGQEYMYVDISSTAKLNYLMLPVLAKVGWNLGQSPQQPHFRLYADAGLFVGYLLSAHQELSDTKTKIYASKDAQTDILGGAVIDIADFTDTNRNTRSDIKNWNVGISGNIGLAYRFNKSSIFVEGGGNYGFIEIQEDTRNGKNHTGAATVDIGYAYHF